MAGPVARAVRGGLGRRRVQAIVIGLVLLVSTGASVLALALVADSNGPFDQAFSAQHGADVVVTVDPDLPPRPSSPPPLACPGLPRPPVPSPRSPSRPRSRCRTGSAGKTR